MSATIKKPCNLGFSQPSFIELAVSLGDVWISGFEMNAKLLEPVMLWLALDGSPNVHMFKCFSVSPALHWQGVGSAFWCLPTVFDLLI